MKPTKDHISLETAKLLKDCGIESKLFWSGFGYIGYSIEEVFKHTWEITKENLNKRKDKSFTGDFGGENDLEWISLPAFTWQEILWEHAGVFFENGNERITYDNDKLWREFYANNILCKLQQKKYEEADLYFRENCILIKK